MSNGSAASVGVGSVPHRGRGGAVEAFPVVDLERVQPVAGATSSCVSELGKLILPQVGEQELVEGLEAAPLIGGGDVGAAGHELVEQRALAAIPAGDALARRAVEAAEVLLHLTEVGEQLPCRRREQLVPIPHRGLVEQFGPTLSQRRDLLVDRSPTALQLGDPSVGISLAAPHDLTQQLDSRVEPRLGADERALLQRFHPPVRLLDRGHRVVVHLVGVDGVELAQPSACRVRPVVEVGLRRARVGLRVALPGGVEVVVERIDEPAGGRRTFVLLDEVPAEERQHEGRAACPQQLPRRVPIAQRFDVVEVHLSRLRRPAHGGRFSAVPRHRAMPDTADAVTDKQRNL